ncbi:MAG TPA: TetR/AcrR family transcriptional regulator [Vicinamibacterales bacterium]|nr:TetR/AcrR family transcriptional regulator [Vicinamibacterales bacterium]
MSSARTRRAVKSDSASGPKGGDPTTRERICEAALRLIVKRGGVDVPLADVAKAARVSRQALYLHFRDRAALFLAVAQHADEKRGLPEAIRRLQQAPTGLDALRYMAATRATLNPEIWPLARILDGVRRDDPAAEVILQQRRVARLGACRMIVEQLARDGTLRPGLEPSMAADLLWALTSIRTWEDLVLVRGWTAAQYEERLVATLLRVLTNVSEADRSSASNGQGRF